MVGGYCKHPIIIATEIVNSSTKSRVKIYYVDQNKLEGIIYIYIYIYIYNLVSAIFRFTRENHQQISAHIHSRFEQLRLRLQDPLQSLTEGKLYIYIYIYSSHLQNSSRGGNQKQPVY